MIVLVLCVIAVSIFPVFRILVAFLDFFTYRIQIPLLDEAKKFLHMNLRPRHCENNKVTIKELVDGSSNESINESESSNESEVVTQNDNGNITESKSEYGSDDNDGDAKQSTLNLKSIEDQINTQINNSKSKNITLIDESLD